VITVALKRSDPASSGTTSATVGSATDPGNATGLTAGGIGPTGLTETVAAGHAYSVNITQSDATPSVSDLVFMIEVTYDHPV
jgi:hypothetical protein